MLLRVSRHPAQSESAHMTDSASHGDCSNIWRNMCLPGWAKDLATLLRRWRSNTRYDSIRPEASFDVYLAPGLSTPNYSVPVASALYAVAASTLMGLSSPSGSAIPGVTSALIPPARFLIKVLACLGSTS